MRTISIAKLKLRRAYHAADAVSSMSGEKNLTVTVKDDDTGEGNADQRVMIHNVAPKLFIESIVEVPDSEPR